MKATLVLAISAVTFMASDAWAKDNFYIRLGGYYSYGRLERSALAGGSSFSILSQSGYQGQAVLGKYFGDGLNIYLSGMYYGHSFVGPTTHTIQSPQTSLGSGSLGAEFSAKDMVFYLLANYRTLAVLNDVSASVHDMKPLGMPAAILGFKLRAYSRFGYEMEVDLSGGHRSGRHHESRDTKRD